MNLEQYLIDNKCELYFPYSQEWSKRSLDKIVIAPHPIDNADKGEGTIISLDNKKMAAKVLVDDEYAYNNNVVIIKPIDVDLIADDRNGGSGGNTTSVDTYKPKTFDEFNNENYGYRVKIQYVRSEKFLEGLFDGGAEIYFAMPNAYTATDTVLFNLLKPHVTLSTTT